MLEAGGVAHITDDRSFVRVVKEETAAALHMDMQETERKVETMLDTCARRKATPLPRCSDD